MDSQGQGMTIKASLWLSAFGLLAAPLALAQGESYPPSDAPLNTQLCMTCHGSYGQGSPVVGGPNLTGMEPWYLKRQLENFRAQVRGAEHDYVQGSEMRATAMALSDADIVALMESIGSWEGWSMSDVVQVRVFAVAGEDGVLDFEGFNRGYLQFFGTEENPMKPVRSFVQVADLVVDGWLVEVEIRAARVPAAS